MRLSHEERAPGRWDFDGACGPREDAKPFIGNGAQETFSLGVFQWLQGKTKLKRGAVVRRFRGRYSNPEPTYARARAFCESMEQGR